MTGAGMRIVAAAFAARERGIDQDRRGPNVRREQVVDKLGIVARDRQAIETRQDRGALGIEFVQNELAVEQFGPAREHARPGRRLEDDVILAQPRGDRCDRGQRQRGRKLLQGYLVLGTIGQGREALEHGIEFFNAAGRADDAGLTGGAPDYEDLRRFQRIIGVAHAPDAARIGSAELAGHKRGKGASSNGRSIDDAIRDLSRRL